MTERFLRPRVTNRILQQSERRHWTLTRAHVHIYTSVINGVSSHSFLACAYVRKKLHIRRRVCIIAAVRRTVVRRNNKNVDELNCGADSRSARGNAIVGERVVSTACAPVGTCLRIVFRVCSRNRSRLQTAAAAVAALRARVRENARWKETSARTDFYANTRTSPAPARYTLYQLRASGCV